MDVFGKGFVQIFGGFHGPFFVSLVVVLQSFYTMNAKHTHVNLTTSPVECSVCIGSSKHVSHQCGLLGGLRGKKLHTKMEGENQLLQLMDLLA